MSRAQICGGTPNLHTPNGNAARARRARPFVRAVLKICAHVARESAARNLVYQQTCVRSSLILLFHAMGCTSSAAFCAAGSLRAAPAARRTTARRASAVCMTAARSKPCSPSAQQFAHASVRLSRRAFVSFAGAMFGLSAGARLQRAHAAAATKQRLEQHAARADDAAHIHIQL